MPSERFRRTGSDPSLGIGGDDDRSAAQRAADNFDHSASNELAEESDGYGGTRPRSRTRSRDRTETVSGATNISGLTQRQRDLVRGSGPTIDIPTSERNFGGPTTPTDRSVDDDTARAAAEQIDGITPSMIQDVRVSGDEAEIEFTQTGQRFRAAQELGVDPGLIESVDDGRVEFVAAERERRARERFEQQREQFADGPGFDPRPGAYRSDPTTVFDFESDELEFEATEDGVDISVRESAIETETDEEMEAEQETFIESLDAEETEEPGAAARAVDAFTDGFARINPAATAGIGVLGASLRTESGLPIPRTGQTLPGQSDVSGFQDRLEGPGERIDTGIETAVETVTPGGERGISTDVLPSVDTETALDIASRDAGLGAVATVAGTEFGRDAATEGVTTGLQMFNPARVAQDTATFTDVGVRGTDRLLDADAGEIQTGIDTAEAVGEFAVDEGPTIAAAGVARDPSTLISAPISAATVGVAGVATGTAAVGGARAAGRAGRRVGDSATDVLNVPFTQIQRSARRRRRDLSDINVTLTRDADAPLIDAPEINLSGFSRPGADDIDVTGRIRDTVQQSRLRRRPRRDETNIVDSLSADLRFTGEEAGRRVARRLDRPVRDQWTPIQDIGADVRFDAQQFGQAVRSRLTPRRRRDERNVLGRLRGDLRFSATEARARSSDLVDDIGRAMREATSPDSGFLADTRTRGTRAPPGVGASGRGRLDVFDDFEFDISGGFLGDARTGRARPFLGAAGAADETAGAVRGLGTRARETFDVDLSGGFLADDATGRTRPFVGVAGAVEDAQRSARSAMPSVPSIPRSFDDIGIGGEGGFRDLTLRVETPNRRPIDVENLDGPEPGAGTPFFRQLDADIDGAGTGGASPTTGGRIDSDVDVGGGLIASRQQQTVGVDDATAAAVRSQRRETLDRDTFGFAPFGVGAGGGTMDAPTDAIGTVGEIEIAATEPTVGTEAIIGPSVGPVAEDDDTGTGAGAGTAVGVGLFGATGVGAGQAIEAVQTPQLATEALGDVTTPGTTVTRPRRRMRPRPLPAPDGPTAFDDEQLDDGIGFDDETFENPTRTFDEVDDLVAEIGDLRGGQ